MHALAGAGVAHRGVHAQFVFALGEARQGQSAVAEAAGVQGVAVEGGGAQLGGPDLDECVRAGVARRHREADHGAGVEGVVPGGEVEFDRVPVDVQEGGTGLRFVARQYGHGGHAA